MLRRNEACPKMYEEVMRREPWVAGTQGGECVEVQGSFDGWQKRHIMQKSGKDHTIVLLLQPGVYQVRVRLLNFQRVQISRLARVV